MLRRRRDTAVRKTGGEGAREQGDTLRIGRERPRLGGDEGAVDVRHVGYRREIDVRTGSAKASAAAFPWRRTWAGVSPPSSAADRDGGAQPRRRIRPPSWSAVISGTGCPPACAAARSDWVRARSCGMLRTLPPKRMTPPTWPARTRASRALLGAVPRIATISRWPTSCSTVVAPAEVRVDADEPADAHAAASARTRTSERIAATLRGILHPMATPDGWAVVDNALQREFEFASFPEAIAFVSRVADLAERENHHPDIDIRYRRVVLRWSTHTAGGITDRDSGWPRSRTTSSDRAGARARAGPNPVWRRYPLLGPP